MTNIADILREATEGQIDEQVLSEIENAFNQRLEEKAKLHVDKALLEQDELYSEKLESLLEAIDADHTKKLKKVVEQIKSDANNGDFIAIEELLSDIPIQKLKGFLTEEKQN